MVARIVFEQINTTLIPVSSWKMICTTFKFEAREYLLSVQNASLRVTLEVSLWIVDLIYSTISLA